ncbi:MAG: Error-prone repair protein ImuA [Bacteroidota bacterium]
MQASKADIIQQLQQQIFPLQGLKHTPAAAAPKFGLGPIEHAFPNHCFPTGAIHEFICDDLPGTAASGGFIAGLLGVLMKDNGASLWISSSRTLFPPALSSFGLSPDRLIFIDVKNEKHLPWVLEEALKCNGLSAVVGEIKEMSFTASRRLQLAVEQSRVTGFLLRQQPKCLATTACVARWKINSLISEVDQDLPGIGFPRWKVDLLKIRNGKPGSWEVSWIQNQFRFTPVITAIPAILKRKAG